MLLLAIANSSFNFIDVQLLKLRVSNKWNYAFQMHADVLSRLETSNV